eukprot:Platyproteum_vivax@DN6398_c0_g2_i2.p1
MLLGVSFLQRNSVIAASSLITHISRRNKVFGAPMSQQKHRTAACLIIGDEVLKGRTHDTNSHFTAKQLYKLGINLERIEVIGDIQETIVSTVQRLSASHNYVFTSGGIGPTHDDITYLALARAFNDELTYHEPTLHLMNEYFKEKKPESLPLNEARRRMALLPSRSKVYTTEGLWVPLAVLENGCLTCMRK